MECLAPPPLGIQTHAASAPLKVALRLLGRMGYTQVETAQDGEQALSSLVEAGGPDAFHAILMDLHMPGLVCRGALAGPTWTGCPARVGGEGARGPPLPPAAAVRTWTGPTPLRPPPIHPGWN